MSSCEVIEPTAVPPPRDDAPRLAAGVELLGPSQGGDSEEPRFLYRLADGQAVEVSHLMHLVTRRLDGSDVGQIARQVTDEVGRRLSPDNVSFLIDQKLRPLGLVAGDEPVDRSSPPTPLLGLRFRAAFLPAGVVRGAAALLRPLFLPPVVLGVLLAVVATDLWLFLDHGVGGAVHRVLREPALVPAVWAITLLAGVFHELGHATACRYGGGRPGRIGFGLYLLWPVFYSDVTDSYRLDRRARLRTDLGGLYFNLIVVLVMAGVYALAGWEFALVALVIQHLGMLQQLLPFVRLDGYYVVADLVGVPDLFAYVKPIVTSVFRRAPHPEVAALGRRTRRVVTVWVLVTVPVLAASLVLLAVHLPSWSATAFESATEHVRLLIEAIDEGGVSAVAGPALDAAALVLPLVAVALTLLLAVVRIVRRLAGWMRPRRRRDRLDAELAIVPADDYQREDDSLVHHMINQHVAVNDVRRLDHPVQRPGVSHPGRDNGDSWDADLDLGVRLDETRASIGRQADELVETVSRTIEAARHELHIARTLRTRAEEEAEAIRAAAQRDAVELLAQTRDAVDTLLQDLSMRLGAASTDPLEVVDRRMQHH